MRRLWALLALCLLLTGCKAPEEALPRDQAHCLALARDIERRYGIAILMGEDAAAQAPWDYEFAPEPQTSAAYRQLQGLDTALASFPPALLDALFADTVTICLVRKITGIPGAGAMKTASGLQFSDDAGITLALTGGTEAQKALYHELYHLMEPRLTFEDWDALNPAGFTYENSHTLPADLSPSQGENRAFVDGYSMTSPEEDRARIFEYAMEDGNKDLFQSEILQAKLSALCAAIREEYGLEEDACRWEQYLIS